MQKNQAVILAHLINVGNSRTMTQSTSTLSPIKLLCDSYGYFFMNIGRKENPISQCLCDTTSTEGEDKKKKHMFLVRISIKRERAGFFLLFIVSYCRLSLHFTTFPRGYVGALRSNINKMKHQILIKHSFV